MTDFPAELGTEDPGGESTQLCLDKQRWGWGEAGWGGHGEGRVSTRFSSTSRCLLRVTKAEVLWEAEGPSRLGQQMGTGPEGLEGGHRVAGRAVIGSQWQVVVRFGRSCNQTGEFNGTQKVKLIFPF